jgi:hypothetical protein
MTPSAYAPHDTACYAGAILAILRGDCIGPHGASIDMGISLRKHVIILVQASVVWLVFWLIGWPAYFQQYSDTALGVMSTLLSVAFCLFALAMLLPRSPQRRMPLAFWLSFYYTAPLALYDWLYCGLYLGHGAGYLTTYWYLSVFYVSIWLTFVPIAYLLNRRSSAQHAGVAGK